MIRSTLQLCVGKKSIMIHNHGEANHTRRLAIRPHHDPLKVRENHRIGGWSCLASDFCPNTPLIDYKSLTVDCGHRHLKLGREPLDVDRLAIGVDRRPYRRIGRRNPAETQLRPLHTD